MAFKLDVVGMILPLAAVGAIGYFAITYGPGILDTVNAQIQTALSAGLPAPPVSGATAIVSGATTGTCTTGNTQMDQSIIAMGMDVCTAMGQTPGQPATGTGGLGPLNPGIPSPIGSAWQNTGGIPGQFPGTVPGTIPTYPQYTGATQFQATPLGSAQITCPNGVCRSYVGEVINV